MRSPTSTRFLLLLGSLITFLGLLSSLNAQISSFPYVEDFEASSTCGTGCGATCVLTGTGFTNSVGLGDNLDWLVDENGTSSSSTGPSVDHTTGSSTGNYLYIETSCSGTGYPNKEAHLWSPVLDFSIMNSPQLEFWYHMYGTSMGNLHIDVSSDGGTTWDLDIVPSRTDNQDFWQLWTVNLGGYAGDTVIIRWRGVSGSSFGSDMAVDDVVIDDLLPLNAGVNEIVSPSLPTCALGLIPVEVAIKNDGTDTLTNVDVVLEVNGSVVGSSSWTGNLPQAGIDTFFVGTFTINSGDQVRAWTTNPNGATEAPSGTGNDTLGLTTSLGLSGDYTIGGTSPDYADFTTAVADLQTFGVCGPTVFKVRDGIYTEQVLIQEIQGVSSSNTVTFQSESGDSSLVELTFESLTGSANYTVQMNGVDWMTFRDMTISASGLTYGRVIDFNGESDHNRIAHCRIVGTPGNTTTSTNKAVIYSNPGTIDNYNTFENNQIENGSFGMYWYGKNTTDLEEGTVLRGNKCIGVYYKGMELYYHDAPVLENNSIDLGSSPYTGSRYGLYLFYCDNALSVQNNSVCTYPGYGYGLYIGNCDATSGNPSLIANNDVSVGSPATTSTSYGIYCTNIGYHQFVHNSVNVVSSGASSRALYVASGGGNSFLNNNLVCQGPGYAVYVNGNYSISESDYNNLYSTGTNLAYFEIDREDLAALQAATGFDANSISVDPGYFSEKDLHVCNPALEGAATPRADVTTDFDDETRSTTAPDIGADEYTSGASSIAAGFTSVILGNGVQFTDATTGGPLTWDWDFGDGNTDNTQNPTHFYAGPGYYTVCLIVSKGCARDTFCELLTIGCPPHNTTWTSGTSAVSATFTDETAADISFWLWDFGDGNTSTQQNPAHTYASLGTYTVCLTTTSSCGFTDSTCHTVVLDCSYFTVDAGPDQVICPGNTAGVTIGGGPTQTGGIGNITYSWVPGGLSSQVVANPVATPASDKTYTVTVSDDYCTKTDNVTVIVGIPTGGGFLVEDDFEASPNCGTGCGASCVLSNSDFHNVPNGAGDNLDWLVDEGGTSSSVTGPSIDHTTGSSSGHYLYVETSCSGTGYPNKVAHLHSPVLDLSSSVSPAMEFWYHMYGTSMGTMHIDVSPDSGATWDTDIVPARTDNKDQWQKWKVNLSAYGGLSKVIVRIRGISGNSFGSDMAVDDIKFFEIATLDAGLCGIDQPGLPSCNLNGDVRVCIKNFGATDLSSVDIHWSVNGVLQTPYTWNGNLATDTEVNDVLIGNTPLAVGDVLKVWTDAPNGQCEALGSAINDTITRTLEAGLSGVYTIGGTAPDYASFQAAVDDLNANGVCGPTIFDVRDGTYSEQIALKGVQGASAVNTITFRSESGDSSLVNLSYSSFLSSQNHTLFLEEDAAWFNFEKITMSSLGTTYGRVIEVEDEAHHNRFANCLILGMPNNTTTSTNKALVYSETGKNNDHFIFENNRFENGSYAMYWYGASTTSLEKGTVIRGNDFVNQYYYGVRLYYQDGPVVEDNNLDMGTSTYTGARYGIYMVYCDKDFSVQRNNVCVNPGYGYGIYMSNCDGNRSNFAMVANNMISVGSPSLTNTSYGIYSTNSGAMRILHNSVLMTSNGTSSRAFYATSGGLIEVLNNHFVNDGPGYTAYLTSSYSVSKMDYNNLRSAGTNLAYFNGDQVELAAWQAASGFDANSFSTDPGFVSDKDLHRTTDECDSLVGTPQSDVLIDIDGDARVVWEIGADEDENRALPVLSCVPLVPLSVTTGTYETIVPADVIASLTDACGIASEVLSKDTFTVADTGPNMVILTVTSISGGTASCTTTVDVTACTAGHPGIPVQVLPAHSCYEGQVNLASLVRDYSLQAGTFHYYSENPAIHGFGSKIAVVRAYRGQVYPGSRAMATILSDTCFWVIATPYGVNPGSCASADKVVVTLDQCGVRFMAKALLEGAYDGTTGFMRDGLRQQNLIPLVEPYSSLGYSFVSGGGESTSAAILNSTGNDAIVDWVVVELRDNADPELIHYSRAALLQRDGDIVDTDGSSLILLPNLAWGNYHLAVLHRNHLNTMTGQVSSFNQSATVIDLSDPNVSVYGTNQSRQLINGKALIISGDADGNGQIQNTDDVLQWMPNAGTAGYKRADYNLDGQVQNTDRILIWTRNVGKGTAVPK